MKMREVMKFLSHSKLVGYLSIIYPTGLDKVYSS
jgi:hypothetical protein